MTRIARLLSSTADLRTTYDHSSLLKFADDTYLIVPASNRYIVMAEKATSLQQRWRAFLPGQQ